MMKAKRILSFLVLLAVLLTALPVYAFATFSGPSISELEAELTNENEGLVYFSDFEGAEFTPASKQGTQNATLDVSGCTEKTGPYFNKRYVRDYWVSDGYRNIYTDGHKLIWRAHDKSFTSPGSGNDDNNNLQIDFKNVPAGADFVFSFDIALYAEAFTGSFSFYFISNYATSQLKVYPITVASDGSIKAGSKASSPVVLDPEIGEEATITTHVRIIDPDASVEGDVGKVLMDVYVDGVLVIEGQNFLSTDQIKTISKVTHDDKNADAKAPENNTGISSDFKPSYIRLVHSGGTQRAKDASGNNLGANGQDLLSLDNVRIYFSDECYERKNTVSDASISYGAGGCDVCLDLSLDEEFINATGATVRFTDSKGGVTDIPVDGKKPDADGLYTFGFTLPTECYSDAFTLELIGEGSKQYGIYENGIEKTAYTNTIANI